MGLTNEHVGPKVLSKIKIYVLTRAELLFKVCYEIPCSIFLIVHILKSLFKIFFFNFFFFPFWFTSIGFSLALLASSHFFFLFFLDDGFSFIIRLLSLFILSFHQQFFHWPFRLSHFFFLDDPLKLNYFLYWSLSFRH